MDVIPVVLKTDVVILDQEVGAVDDVIMRRVSLLATDPGEVHFVESGLYNFVIQTMGYVMLLTPRYPSLNMGEQGSPVATGS